MPSSLPESVFVVSTSAKYGAIILVFVPAIPKGVYVSKGAVKVTFPLLLTYSWLALAPKKLMLKPIEN